ncbi:MAG: tRNA-dihydrouridine synthase family protein [Clostridia bacterium]
MKSIGKNNLILSPMAGFTDVGMRYLCHKYGAGLTVTEMISAKALTMNNLVTRELLVREKEDCPIAVQLFGHETNIMAEAVRLVEKDFDVVDINMGCPMRKIVSNGDGSALMENMSLASKIIESAVRNTNKPVTVKFRLGISDDSLAFPFAHMCQDSGATAITIHGRTREQMYSGEADFEQIARVVSSVSIPVYCNGDVKDKQSYIKAMSTGAYGVAIGRGALGNPQVFSEILGLPYEVDVYSNIVEHYNILIKYHREHQVVSEMKKHIAYYIKGRRGSKVVINAIMQALNAQQLLTPVREFLLTK